MAESDPIFNTDASEALTRIANALNFYSKTIPNAAVPQVAFGQSPREETRWKATVRLKCLGDIKMRSEPSVDFLDGAEATTVFDKTWEAEGEGFAGAVEELVLVVQKYLAHTIHAQKNALGAAESALAAMDSPVSNLSEIWRTEDPDDDAEEG